MATQARPSLRGQFRASQHLTFGGDGKITGTVKVAGPPEAPVRRRVRLIRERDGLTAGETWSDPDTGAYSFTFIDREQTYTVLSYDHTETFRAEVADRITPEPMT